MSQDPRGATINVSRLIDEGPISKFQVTAIFLCSIVAFLDGLDSLSIAVAAPIIVEQLKLGPSMLGPIFSVALLGAMVGALTFGTLGDRFGRKRILILAALIFGVFTLLTAFASSFPMLLAARFMSGVGLGGATPCFIALACEYAPKTRRAMVASLIWAAFPLGGAVGGFVNAYVLATFGWQTIFIVGGILPLALALILVVWLPESIRFLLAKGAQEPRVTAIVARLNPSTPLGGRYVTDEVITKVAPLKTLFDADHLTRTLLLWVPFFTAFGTLALVVYWTPALLRGHGIPLSQSSLVIGVNSIGSLIGMSTAGWLIDRFGALRVLLPAFLIGALSTGGLGYAASSAQSVAIVMFIVGLSVGMAASGSIALAALTYRTAIRSTGIGWAMGMGRFGQVLAPILASAITVAGWGDTNLFLTAATAPVIGALTVAVLCISERLSGHRRMVQIVD